MTPQRFALYALTVLFALCLALAVLFVVRDAVAAPVCTITIPTSQNSLSGGVSPGAVVCLAAGNRGSLSLSNLTGTAAASITIINSGGVVRIASSGEGIQIKNSEHLRVTGSGVEEHCGAPFAESDQRCGIVVTGGSGRGVSGIERTRHIEVDHVEVNGSAEAAINLKSPTATRASGWVQTGVRVHSNFLHDITRGDRGGAEGLYLGMSDYAGGSSHLTRDVDVYANLTARTGWEGLQVSSAIADCRVRDNVVLDHSLANESGQQGGVTLKAGSVCDVTGNTIRRGSLHGIFDYGSGGSIVGNCIENVTGDGINIRQTPGTSVKRRMTITDNRVNGQGGAVVGGTSNLSSDSVVARNGPGACTGGVPSTATATATPTVTRTATVLATASATPSPTSPLPTSTPSATPSPSATVAAEPTGEPTPRPLSPALQAALDANGDTAASEEMQSVLGVSGNLYVQVGDGTVVVAAP